MNNQSKFITIVLLVLGLPLGLAAQHINHQFRHLSFDDGIAHPDATCVQQDSLGFIWIGTFSGLNRYDGYELKNFTNNREPQERAYANRIQDMFIDKHSKIWLATQASIECFDIHTESFLSLEVQRAADKGGWANLNYVHYDEGSDILVTGNANGLKAFHLASDSLLVEIEDWNIEELGRPIDIQANEAGQIWGISQQHIFQIVFVGNSLESHSWPLPAALFGQVRAIYPHQKDIWLVTQEGLLRLDTTAIQAEPTRFPFDTNQLPASLLQNDRGNPLITDFIKDPHGNFWLSTTHGLLKCELQEQKLSVKSFQKTEPITKFGLSASHINGLFVDNTDCLWLSTFGGGISSTSLNPKPFYLIQKGGPEAHSISGNYVRAILEDRQGNLWIGTREEGLNKYTFEQEAFTYFRHEPNNRQSISSNQIRSLAEDQQGRIWIGTVEGIDIYDESNGQFSRLPIQSGKENHLSAAAIFTIARDKFGQMWAGSWDNGLNRIHYLGPNKYQIEQVLQKGTPWTLTNQKVTFIYADETYPEVLVGTNNGLNHIYLDERGEIREVVHYKAEDQHEQSLSSNFVWPIIRTGPNTLWVGTIGGGLNKLELDPKRSGKYQSTVFDLQGGAPANDIESILLDESGKLWLGSKGLSCFDPETETFLKFDVNDGLQSNSFKIGSAFKGASGRLYFGGINGLNYFDPTEIRENEQQNEVVITNLHVNHEEVALGQRPQQHFILEKNINYTENITLNHLENNFSIAFSSLDFSNPDKCQYRFMLEGYDEDWIITDAQTRKASYSNLKYGDYTFSVQGSNSDGHWGDQIKQLHIIVKAPWWNTHLAQAIYVLLVLLAISLIFYYFTRWYKIKKAYEFALLEEHQMEELHKMRLEFFTNVSHEFKTPLTLILNPLEQLLEGNTPPKKLRRYLQTMHNNANRLLNLVNELMTFRKVESGTYQLEASKIDLSLYLEAIFENFREHAIFKDIDFSFKSEGLVDNCWVDKRVIEKILVNLLGNAFKYTEPGGQVKLEIGSSPFSTHLRNHFSIKSDYEASAYVWIKVEDSGVGISQESIPLIFDRYFRDKDSKDKRMGSGVGLALVRSMILLHKGKLDVYSEPYKGTCFLVGIPRGNGHLAPQEMLSTDIFKKAEYDLPKLDQLKLRPPSLLKLQEETVNSKSRLLIVEDNQELRHFLKEHLEDNYRVLEAAHGQEALDILNKEPVDVILSDVMMPIMNGIDLCKQVKENQELNHIPFVLLTAKTSAKSRIEGRESGADIYLAKPFSLEELKLTINNILSSRQQLRNLYLENAFSEARELALVEKEKDFVSELISIIEEHIEDNKFDVDYLCREMGMSRTKLYGKVKSVTGKSIGEIIRGLRLRKAAEILASEDISINQVMYRVGIQSQSYFTKSFKKEFGKTPTQFVKEL